VLKDYKRDYIYLSIDKPLFYSDSLSRYSSSLISISPEPYAKISSALANNLSIVSGDIVSVSTDIGSIKLPAHIDEDLPENTVYISNIFKDKGAFGLMSLNVNPITKSLVIDGTEVVVKKAEEAVKEVLT